MTLPQVKEKFLFRAVKEEEILTQLKNLKRKNATGLDNLPPGLPKDAAGVIVPWNWSSPYWMENGQGDSHL